MNLRFWQWLEEDYQRKVHSGLGMSPLDYFMTRVDRVNIFPDPQLLDEYFLLRVTRKINHDATFPLEKTLYEVDQQFAGTRLEVRYEPQWLTNPARPLLLYKDGLKVGEARRVNFFTNAQLKRRKCGRSARQHEDTGVDTPLAMTGGEVAVPAISFARLLTSDQDGDPTGAGEE